MLATNRLVKDDRNVCVVLIKCQKLSRKISEASWRKNKKGMHSGSVKCGKLSLSYL